MKNRIYILPAANRDLDDQAEYLTVHQSLQMGLRFYRAAEETFRLIARNPALGKRAECRSPFLQGMRMLVLKQFPSHLVFYRSTGEGIEIVRLLHGARDIEAIFVSGDGDDEPVHGAGRTRKVT